MNNREFQAGTEKIERVLQQVNELSDVTARGTALELMQALMDLHGAAIARIVEMLRSSGESGGNALSKIGADPLICGLLVLYGVHPATVEERVQSALEGLKPQLQKLGMSVEVKGCADSNVRIHVRMTRGDSHSSTSVRTTIEQAIRELAPEINEISIDGLVPSGFVALDTIEPAAKFQTGEVI